MPEDLSSDIKREGQPSAGVPEAPASHVFAGSPDSRQGNGSLKPTRFRPRYRALSEDEKKLHDEIKAAAEHLEKLYDQIGVTPSGQARSTPFGRYKALALTALEESVMWAVKELTA